MVKYSIIIPHYNIPDLLGRCLASIPEREDIQVIVVDDCSPDAKEYPDAIPELSRPFVEFYSTPIGGSAGRARNIGVQHATGKWVTFLDADDLFVDNVGQIFDKYSDRTEDVIYFRAASVMSDDLSRISDRNIFGYHFETYFKSNNEQLLRFEFDALWGKLIRKSLIDKYSIRFDEVRYSNDTFFSAAIGVFAKSICVAPETAYIVTERSGSLTAGKMKTFEEWKPDMARQYMSKNYLTSTTLSLNDMHLRISYCICGIKTSLCLSRNFQSCHSKTNAGTFIII